MKFIPAFRDAWVRFPARDARENFICARFSSGFQLVGRPVGGTVLHGREMQFGFPAGAA